MSGLDPFNSLLQDSGGLSNEDYGSLEPEVDEDYEEWKRFKRWKEAKAKALESATVLESASMKPAKPVDTKAGLAGVSYLSNDPHRAPQDELGKLSTAAGIASESAEAKRREAVAENDAGKFTEYLDGLDKAIDYNTELYEQVRKQTLEAFKAGKIDAATFNQRNLLLTGEDGKGGYKASLEADRARTAEARAELSKVRLDQAAGTPEEIWQGLPTNVRDTLGLAGRASQWSPAKTALDMLSGPQEQLAGGASYVAEGLGKLLPGPSVFSDSNIDVGVKDLANSAGGLGLDPDNPLRQRGREFNEKVGSALQAGGVSPLGMIPGLKGLLPGTADQQDRAEAGGLSMGFALTTDPLNVIDFGGVPVLKSMGQSGKLVAQSKAGQKFAGMFPDVIRKAAGKTGLGAKKFAAWWEGDGVRAGVMDTPFEDLYHAQRAKEAGINYDLDLYQTKLAEDAARILNGVSEDKAAELQSLAPLLTERRDVAAQVQAGNFVITDPRIANLAPEDRKVLFELAENISENFDQVQRLENSKWLLDTPDLMGPFDYHGRAYTDEVMQKIAESPTARRVLEAEKMRFNSDAALSWERERKLREFDHFESAKKVRDALRRDGVKISDDTPVWRTDAYQQLSERAAKSAVRAKDNAMYNHFSDMFGEAPDGVDGLRAAGVADYGKAAEPPMPRNFKDYIDVGGDPRNLPAPKTATAPPDPIVFAKNYAKAHLAPVRGKSTALEIMEAHKLQLPDTINEAMRLATTYVDPDDAKRFVRLAEDMDRIRAYEPKRFWRVYDVLKGIAQRSVLGRVSSLTKDNIGTAINLLMGGGVDKIPQAMRAIGDFQSWQKGMGHSDLVRRLRAEGYLQTTRNEALQRGQMKGIADELRAEGKLKRAKLADALGRVENRGVLGSAPDRLGGKVVTEATDILNDWRVYSEEMGRVATYLDSIAKGASHEEAIEKGLSVWGKFDELTKLDRKVLNRIFFFRAWWQRSIPITLRHIIEQPVRSKLLLAMMAGDSQEEDNKYPDWLKRMGGVALGKDGDRVKVLSLGGSSYFSPTFSLLQGDMANALYKGDVLGAASGAMGDTLRASPPFVQSMGELAQKRDYFTNKDWWRDMNTKTDSNIQAPGFLHFLKDTKLGELMNLKEDTKSGKVTINPYYAWVFGLAPGSEPLAQDVSSFTNVRDGGTPLKGFARQLGVPVYDVPLTDDRTQAIREMRAQMKKTVDDLSGHALSITDYGDVIVSDRTERGEKMRDDVARWKEEAKAQGLPESSERFQKYVDDKMRDNYLSEWKLIELSRYLKRWESALRNGKDDPSLKYEPVKIGISTKKFVEQGRKEKLRSLRARLAAP